MPELQLGRLNFFIVPDVLLSIFTLFAFFICFFVLFHSCCSHGQVLWTTFMHEFHIFSSHAEWYFLSAIIVNISGTGVLLN